MSIAKHIIDIICVQEEIYHPSELELKDPDPGIRWKVVLAFAWKNSVNGTIEGVRIFSALVLKISKKH